jgi:hypothetical protein
MTSFSFRPLEGATAILLEAKGGSYRQASLYERNGHVFAEIAARRFVKLYSSGGTSSPRFRVEALDTAGLAIFSNSLGALVTEEASEGAKLPSFPKIAEPRMPMVPFRSKPLVRAR